MQQSLITGIQIPVSLLYYHPLTSAEYDMLVSWGINSIYIRIRWGSTVDTCGLEPDESTVGDPGTGAGYSQSTIQKIQTQINLAQAHGLSVWLGFQDVLKKTCPPEGYAGWQDPYGSDFINLNTQPTRCVGSGLTPMPGRDRFLRLLEYTCKIFPTNIGIIPWDFPYHSGSISSAARTQFYAFPSGSQALLIQQIRNADALHHPNDPPRLISATPIQQGSTPDYPTEELDYQHFYNEGPPWYGENIYYAFDSHDSGYTWAPKTSCWGYICRAADPGTGYITHWDYNLQNFDAMWYGVVDFRAAHPTAKFICYEWIGIVNQGTPTIPGANDRPMDPSRLAWAHQLYVKAREIGGVSVMYFDWWGTSSTPSVASPTDTGGVENQVARIIRYNHTLCNQSTPNAYQWSDGSWHTMQQPYTGGVPGNW